MKTQGFPKLNVTPIKEIVLGISFDGEFQQEKLEPFTKSKIILEHLPFCTPSIAAKVTFKSDSQQTESSSAFEGWIFKNEPTDRVLQVRIGSMSFHLVQKYIALDKLIEELRNYWNEFIKLANGVVVTSVFVRYLNLIPKEPGKGIKDYVTIYPNHAFADLEVDTFSNIRFEYGGADVTLVSTEGEIGNQRGIILDYTIRKKIDPKNDDIFAVYHQLRELKDIVFFNSITQYTIEKHQQL